MSLVEIGRFARNEAHMVIGLLESAGVPAIALDGHASIADGSSFFIPVRVMVDDDDADFARKIVASVPDS